ncbi:Outer membrane ferripyoverdine receptor FpvA, TonB-dependent [Pseudomonas chlororaphis]|uniref:TonB-dependent siderophore receptor n=1 Tax=Pseudomonas chlororaphis TaxID=587753 RepID=UPI000F58542F|nr:TonB-dependent siderophore receptor [Pseudomonas chlororaphis]AZD09452.1 Outer membrane ferripyoverdine receptor FpvA, TonB-dependent [Pseudomonas chlororaphis]
MPAVLGLSPLSKALSMRKALNIKLLPSALALAVSLPVAGYVQAQEIELDIPVQSLGSALQEFGRQTNLQVLYSPQDVQGRQSTAVKGKMDAQRAIGILLTGSGIQYSLQGNSLTLSALSTGAEGLELSPTQVTANQLGNVTEGTGSYTPGTIATATRLPLTLRETPQSISVVTRQHMDDFALNSVDAVMRHTPGITVSAFDTDRTNYYSRGFSINNFQYDGIPSAVRNVAYSAGNTLSDMAIYDRIEVLKGASGLLSGAGSLGGTINLVRKKPTADFQGHATLGAGSWDNYRSELDVSGPLTETGNVRGRAVAAYQDKHSFIDRYSTKNSVFYGIVEFDLSPDTLLTVGADYQDNDPRGSTWSGSFPLLNSKGERNDAKRSFSNATDWSSWQQYTRTVFATLEHDLGDGWVTKLQLDHKYNGYDAQMGSIQFDQPQPDGSAEINAQRYKGDTTSDSADLYVSGPFSLLGRDHDLVLGGSISKAHWKGKGYWDETFSVPNRVDYNNWHGNLPKPDWGPVSQHTDDVIRQTGVYMTTRLNVTDDLKVLLGGRVVNYSLTGLTPTSTESGRFIPYAGAIYDLNENFSVYASYTDVFMPQENYYRDSNRKLLEPDEGENYEVGIKSDFFDGRLNASLAYFEVKESNRPIPDDDFNNHNPTLPYAYKGSKATTKGYELEVSGELAPGWQVQGGYTHKVVRDDNDMKLSTFEPEDQLSLYTTYKLTGDLDKMTIGGGARWQNKAWQQIWNSPKGVNEDITQESYWVVDLMTRYQITKNLSATLNVNNIFDKYYYTNVGFYNSAIYGEPRNVMVTTRWDF